MSDNQMDGHPRSGDRRSGGPPRRADDLSDLMDDIDAVIWEADPITLQFTRVSRGAERLLGYPLALWLDQPDFWRKHIHPADRDAAVTTCLVAIQIGEDHDFEYRMIASDGTVRWVRDIVRVTTDARGETARLRGILVDLTERRHAEEAREAREEQLRLLLDSTAEGIYGVDLTGTCTFSNRAAALLLGYGSAADLVGVSMHSQTHHTSAAGSRHPLEECPICRAYQRGEGIHVEDEIFWRANGTNFPVEYWSHPMRHRDQVVGAVVTFLDITERRRAQQALEESEARFRYLIEASFDGVLIVEGGIVREANRGFAEMFGYELSDVIGRPATDFATEESREELNRRISNRIEGQYEMLGRRTNGETIVLEAIARNHVIGGRPVRIVALRDVTEKQRLEAQFRQAQKMEAVGRLAGGIAHDFNNMLTVISSYSDLLLSQLAATDPRREDVLPIRAAAAGAASLTRQLLAFSRQQVVDPRLVVVEDVVASTKRLLHRLIGEDIEMLTPSSGDPVSVRIDPGQVEQVIMNLAVNARDAMPEGGTLTIGTRTVDLNESDAQMHWPATPGRYAVLAVSDTGIGMDAVTQARIFEPFFTTKEVGKGTGLGLATVYGIVKQGGGFISVYSEPGMGTTVRIYLPIADGGEAVDAAPDVPPDQLPALRRGTETILLVEDDEFVRALVRDFLTRYGYTVLTAGRPEEALAISGRHSGALHLLLTDVVMPGMSGRALAQRLAAARPGVRVLYMSGYPGETIVHHGLLGAGIEFIGKPFTPGDLLMRVQAMLTASRTNR
jgi:two-component system, cell cycle sensor histidine kinase and response regulator CckA